MQFTSNASSAAYPQVSMTSGPVAISAPPRRVAVISCVAILAGAGSAAAQTIFADSFESGTPWNWSLLPGGVDPRAVCASPIALVDMTGATTVGNGTAG